MAGSLPDHRHHTPTMLGDFGKDLMLPEPHPTPSRTQHHQHQLDHKGGDLRFNGGSGGVSRTFCHCKKHKEGDSFRCKKYKKGDWGRRLRVTLFMFLQWKKILQPPPDPLFPQPDPTSRTPRSLPDPPKDAPKIPPRYPKIPTLLSMSFSYSLFLSFSF